MIPLKYNLRSLGNRKTTTLATAFGIGMVVFVFSSVLMLSAGKERWAYSDARLGVHSVGTYGANASAPAPEDGSDRNFTLLVARLMKFYGAPDSVVVKLIVTKPNAIASLTGDDVAGWLNIAQ